MNIGILGDIHLRSSRPASRIDNYYERQFEKLVYAYKTFKEHDCSLVLQPGDFFNNYGKDPYDITYSAVAFLILHKIPTYVVFGQHDVKFHNTELTDIPIQILNKTNLVKQLIGSPTIIDDVHLYGRNWNDPFPANPKRTRQFKILVTHQMVINKRKLWKQQTDYTTASDLAKAPFDLIVCGDNHQAFIYKDKVINCGSMMRMNSDQINHKPIFCVFDTETRSLQKFYFPIEPSESVIKKQDNSHRDIEMEKYGIFAQSINQKEFEGELNFRKNINKTIRKKRCRKRTKQIIEQALEQGR